MECSMPGLPVHHQLPEVTQARPLNLWCHPSISSFAIPFSPCPQSFPVSAWFQMSQLFVSGGQSIGVSPSTSVLPMNSQDWSPLGWTCWINLHSKGLSRVFSNTTVWKHQFFSTKLSYSPTLTSIPDDCKNHMLYYTDFFFGKVMFLLFNMLSSCIITCLSRSVCLLISWLQ